MSFKIIRSLMLVSASVSLLAACGSHDTGIEANKTLAPVPPISDLNDAAPAPLAASTQPLPLSDADTVTPVMPIAAPTAPLALTAPAGSMEERIAKLEQSVGALRSDYARIMPAFASLNTTNERIQTLLDGMEAEGKIPAETALHRPATAATPVTTTATPTPVVEAPKTAIKVAASEEDEAAAAVTPAAATEAPPSSGLANSVTSIRIGEHGNKTRLVFDLTAQKKPDFKYDLDNGEKVLFVEMPGSAWAGKAAGTPNSPLIASWNAQKGSAGGSTVAIQLKKEARVLSTEYLAAEGKDPARLVMDIASGG